MAVTASERLVVLLTPEEKQRISARARKEGLTTAEFVRQTLAATLGMDERPGLGELLDELVAKQREVLETLERVDADIARRQATRESTWLGGLGR